MKLSTTNSIGVQTGIETRKVVVEPPSHVSRAAKVERSKDQKQRANVSQRNSLLSNPRTISSLE